MSKETTTWRSERLGMEINLARWGETGVPVLVFPTAGGDFEEIERFHLVSACSDHLEAGRIKIYSVDSLAGREWFTGKNQKEVGAQIQERFDQCLYHEVLPAIRQDCGDPDIDIITAGASVGAYNALSFLCRHPESVRMAICMSGTYNLDKFLKRGRETHDYRLVSPLLFVPDLADDSDHLARIRERFVLLAHGKGKNEDPAEDWAVANMLGGRDIPNRVDVWGEEWHHDWVTWRDMLPKYIDEFVGAGGGGDS